MWTFRLYPVCDMRHTTAFGTDIPSQERSPRTFAKNVKTQMEVRFRCFAIAGASRRQHPEFRGSEREKMKEE